VDLDAPANDYLRTVRLVPAKPNLSPRHRATSSRIPQESVAGGVVGPLTAGRRFGRRNSPKGDPGRSDVARLCAR
jgi:hypothetical protein